MIFSKAKKVLSTLLSLTMIASMAVGIPFTASAASAADVGVSYQVHGQNYGWSQSAKANGATAGTTGESLRIEAIKISLTGTSSLPAGASIVYQVHGQSYGWTQSAKADGVEAGTEKKAKRIEAIRISLKNMTDYKVTYRVHQQTYGWSDWQTTENGVDISKAAIAGVVGKSKRLEAVEIKLVKPETTANVGTAAELSAALANSNIDTINLTANITASPAVTRPLAINFGAYTITGDVSFSYTGKGTSVLTGNPDNRIIGNLTVNTANASFKNGVKVSGKVNIANVEIGTWAELATGNMIYITDPDGSTIDVTGHPVGVEVTANASGSTTIAIAAGGAVDSLTSSAEVTVAVAAGGTVTSLTVGAGAAGSTITNNGTIGTLTAGAAINLVANVAPGKTVSTGLGSVVVSGSQAGSVTVANGSASSGGSNYTAPVVVGSVSTKAPNKDGTGSGNVTNIGKYTVDAVTGNSPNFATAITGTQPLVDVASADGKQTAAKWVGILVTTDKDVTSLAVKTPGTDNFQSLGQSDITEAQAAGASGTKTFVWWLKSENLTTAQSILIKVQGQADRTAVNLSVSFAAKATVTFSNLDGAGLTVAVKNGDMVFPVSDNNYLLGAGDYTYTVKEFGYNDQTGSFTVADSDLAVGSKQVVLANMVCAAPKVDGFYYIDKTHVKVYFDIPVADADADNADNYTFTGKYTGNPSTAILFTHDNSSVVLTLGSDLSLTDGNDYKSQQCKKST